MIKARIILFSVAIIAIIGIYKLPRYVIEDKKDKVELSEPLTTEDDHTDSNRAIPENEVGRISYFKDLMQNSESTEKRVIFADSLAEAFKNGFFYDSAAFYLGELANEIKSVEALRKAGDAYFEAFNFAVSESKRSSFGSKARNYYQMVLAQQPDDLDSKANLAVTYVTSTSPMQGITILREILKEDPKHERALFNLGLLSITSGQFDNAIERFTTLLEYHPENYEAGLYLGFSYLQKGDSEKARVVLEKVVESDADETLRATAKSYLESIN